MFGLLKTRYVGLNQVDDGGQVTLTEPMLCAILDDSVRNFASKRGAVPFDTKVLVLALRFDDLVEGLEIG